MSYNYGYHCSSRNSIFCGRPVTLCLDNTTSASQHPVYWYDLKGSLTSGSCSVKGAPQHKPNCTAVVALNMTTCYHFFFFLPYSWLTQSVLEKSYLPAPAPKHFYPNLSQIFFNSVCVSVCVFHSSGFWLIQCKPHVYLISNVNLLELEK